ncbi:MAG: ribonuclease HII [Dehalococcoidia bacterium]
MVSQPPSFIEEESLRAQGYQLIAGIDEVGRGPLAGPVVAAAAILSVESRPSWLRSVRDSKQLTSQKRELLFECIRKDSVAFGIGAALPRVIDAQGIVAATRLAMRSAVENLSSLPDFLLIDALGLPALNLPQRSIIRGDNLSLSIAVASILAKVTRDRFMVKLDSLFPGYGFVRNKGYGTPEHLEGLRRLGPCPVHRKSFFPVREYFQ